MKRALVVGIIVLFIGVLFTPVISAFNLTSNDVESDGFEGKVVQSLLGDGDVIIVDDEGDGDYTSIKEAVNNSNSGDTIEVYSGTYFEYNIWITKEYINLIGVANEYGGGNDTGKPFINGLGKGTVIWINVSNVMVSNFRIENPWSGGLYVYPIRVGGPVHIYAENVIVSNNTISNSSICGIFCSNDGINIIIRNNRISNCNKSGILLSGPKNSIISNNIIFNCNEYGISVGSNYNTIIGNIIKQCNDGIYLNGMSNKIQGNHIEKVGCGVFIDFYFSIRGNSIKQNNFIDTPGKKWFEAFIFSFNKWDKNYWDDWNGIGPKGIPGIKVFFWIPIPLLGYILLIKGPWVQFDWRPAKEPYDIEV